MLDVLRFVGEYINGAWVWFREHSSKAIVVVLAVGVMSFGAIRLEDNQNAIKETQRKDCQRANDTNDGIHNILSYLDQRRMQGSTPPLTPEQAATEAHIRELIPPHNNC